MSKLKHRTYRYIRDRIGLMMYERRQPGAPWLTASANEFLDHWLKPSDSGVEWGGGRSTVWLASRVARIFTIEENPAWGEQLHSLLDLRGLRDRVDLNIVPIDRGTSPADARYVTIVRALKDASLDFCLVDGDLRDHCAVSAISLLKPGGLMIVDNVERYIPRKQKTRSPNARSEQDGFASAEWETFARAVSTWRAIWTTNGVTDTAIWLKPCAGAHGG